jgi:hypothetical protein
VSLLECPKDEGELESFRAQIEEVRLRGRVTSGTSPKGPKDVVTPKLVDLADRRWTLVTSTTFLWDAMAMTLKSDCGGRLAQSVLGVLALYVGDLGGLILIPRQPEQLVGRLIVPSGAFADEYQEVLKIGLGLESTAIRPSGRREYWIITYMVAPEPLAALVDTLAGKVLR